MPFLKPTPQPPLSFGSIPVDDSTPAFMSNASATVRGFPSGCFYIRAANGTQRYWTMRWGETHQDGNGIDLDVFAKHEQVCQKNLAQTVKKIECLITLKRPSS